MKKKNNVVESLRKKNSIPKPKIKINKITFRPIGYAFVEFVTDEGAKKSIEVTILIKTQNPKPKII